MEKKRGIRILEVNMLFLVVAVLLLTVGSYVQHREVKSGLLITEYILVMLPAIFFIKINGESLKEVLRLNSLRAKHGILIVLITIFTYPVALFFNLIAMTILSTFGRLEQMPIPTAENFKEYVILMMIISVSAGICEEVFFRGLLLRTYERLGKEKAIFLTAVLFGMFHFNLQNLFGPMVLGLVFGYLVYETNSLYAGIIGHMTNNGFAVTLGFLMNRLNEKILGDAVHPASQMMPNTLQFVGAAVLVGFLAAFTGTLAYVLLRIIIKDTRNQQRRGNLDMVPNSSPENKPVYEKVSMVSFIPVVITCMLFLALAYFQITQLP